MATKTKQAKVPVGATTLSTLADGYAGRAIDSGLARIQEDIVKRGHDGQKRTLTIKLTFTPDDKGRSAIDVDVSVKTPGYKPPKTMAKYDQQAGGLVFNPDCSENPDQLTLPETGDEE